MNNKNVFKDFLKYVSFNIFGQMAYSCYTLADTFFVSANLGANGLTALNLAFPVFCFMNGTGLMIGMGAGIRYSLLRSRGDSQKTDHVFTNAVYMAVFFAVIFSLSGMFLSGAIAKALGADEAVFDMTNTYLQVMLLFSPAFLANNLLQCFVRNDGNPSLSMIAMFTGSMSNVVLDYIFIFPLGMGIFGAILATGLSPVISIMVLSSYFFRRKNNFHFVKALPNRKETLKIISNGIPSLVTELSSGIVMLVFNFIILRLEGNTGVAAFGVITVVSLVVVAIYTGLSQGIQPIISLHYGTGEAANVKAIQKYAMLTMLLVSGVIYGIIFLNAPQITIAFNSEKNELLQRFSETGLKLYFLACPVTGFNIVTATYFTSTECSRPAQIISCLRGFFILIPMVFILSTVLGITGVWLAYPLTECAVALVGAVFYLSVKRTQL